MSTLALTTDSLYPTPRGAGMVLTIIAVLSISFFFVEHDSLTNLDGFALSADETADSVAEGDAARRSAFLAMGLFGAFLLARREGLRLDLSPGLGWMLLIYLVWCGASILWSTDMVQTSRRVMQLFLCCIAALGVARQVTMRQLCIIAMVVTSILILNGVRTEIASGIFRPFAPEYRFAGTIHPNLQATYCATMALAAACLASRAKHGRFLLWSLCATGTIFLVLTKSRTTFGAILAGLLVASLCGTSWQKKILIGSLIVGTLVSVSWIGVLLDLDLERHAVDAALLGRQDGTEASLTGASALGSITALYRGAARSWVTAIRPSGVPRESRNSLPRIIGRSHTAIRPLWIRRSNSAWSASRSASPALL